jgi:hypothetical protein
MRTARISSLLRVVVVRVWWVMEQQQQQQQQTRPWRVAVGTPRQVRSPRNSSECDTHLSLHDMVAAQLLIRCVVRRMIRCSA